MAFSPDGKEVYFPSSRLGDPRASGDDSLSALFESAAVPHAVPVTGRRVQRLWPTAALEIALHLDGKRFPYADDAGALEDPWRKHPRPASSRHTVASRKPKSIASNCALARLTEENDHD